MLWIKNKIARVSAIDRSVLVKEGRGRFGRDFLWVGVIVGAWLW